MNKACKNCKYFKHITAPYDYAHVDSGLCKKFNLEENKNSTCDAWEEDNLYINDSDKWYVKEAKFYISGELWKSTPIQNPEKRYEIKWIPPIETMKPVEMDVPIEPIMDYKTFVFELTNPHTLRYDLTEIRG